MAEPSYFSEGVTQRRPDTRLRVWTKILGALQNDGGLVGNNPRRTDSLRIIKQKVLHAYQGTTYNG